MTEEERTIYFQSMVLRALWLIMTLLFRGRVSRECSDWRADALQYFDLFGNQSEGAPEHRRETDFKMY